MKELGDHIIIGIDANKDVRTDKTQETFRALGMSEIILHHHRNPPATCNKNNNHQPIDGLFTTPGIRLVAGGYSAFNDGCPSDHRYTYGLMLHSMMFLAITLHLTSIPRFVASTPTTPNLCHVITKMSPKPYKMKNYQTLSLR